MSAHRHGVRGIIRLSTLHYVKRQYRSSSNTVVCTGRLSAEHFHKICLSFQLSPATHGPTYPAAQSHSPEVNGETETSSRHGTVPELWLSNVQLHHPVTPQCNYICMVFIGGLMLSQEQVFHQLQDSYVALIQSSLGWKVSYERLHADSFVRYSTCFFCVI